MLAWEPAWQGDADGLGGARAKLCDQRETGRGSKQNRRGSGDLSGSSFSLRGGAAEDRASKHGHKLAELNP